MTTETFDADVVAGISVYGKLHHELTDPEHDVARRDDAEVRRDVVRALVLDSSFR